MRKTTVTRLFVGGIAAIVVGNLLMAAAAAAALASGLVRIGGPTIVAVDPGSVGWQLVALAILASLAMAGGSVAAVGSWLGALRNTWRLDDKTWFGLVLVLGVVSLGVVAMIAYVIAGPDGTRADQADRRLGTVLGG